MKRAIAKLALLVILIGCGGPDLLPTEDYEKIEVIPLFYYEGGDDHLELPSVIGASNCRRAAMTFAALKNVEDTNWTYICATTDGKHKIR